MTVTYLGREYRILVDHGADTFDIEDVVTGRCYRVAGVYLRPVN